MSGGWHADCDCGWWGERRDTKRQARLDWLQHNSDAHGGSYVEDEDER